MVSALGYRLFGAILDRDSSRCAQVLAPDFVASVTYSGEQRALLSGRQLNPLVDVLFTVFENIVHHSQLKHPSAEVHVALRAGGELAIRVDNPVGQGIANDAALNSGEDPR